MEKTKLYRLNVDEVLSNLCLFTKYDIGGVRDEVIVEEETLENAIEELTDDFNSLLRSSFEEYEEEEDF